MSGVLFLVSTPIGNYDDITIRALNVLKTVDLIVIEEKKEGGRLLHFYSIDKPTEVLNEHNEVEVSDSIINYLISGKNIAVISDSGTPVFSDPGQYLVKKAISKNIKIVPVPGASSLMPALIVTGFPLDNFMFYGWLSPKSEIRKSELKKLKKEKQTIVLMDTPYRLISLLRDIAEIFGNSRKICISYNLTMHDEKIFHGTATDLYKEISSRKLKGEFVIVIEGITN